MLLLNILKGQHDKLGFSKLDDEIFELLCIARIVEPTSKLNSLRVLADLGGISIKQFVKLLRPIRSGIVTINGKEILAELEVPESVKELLIRLSSGH